MTQINQNIIIFTLLAVAASYTLPVKNLENVLASTSQEMENETSFEDETSQSKFPQEGKLFAYSYENLHEFLPEMKSASIRRDVSNNKARTTKSFEASRRFITSLTASKKRRKGIHPGEHFSETNIRNIGKQRNVPEMPLMIMPESDSHLKLEKSFLGRNFFVGSGSDNSPKKQNQDLDFEPSLSDKWRKYFHKLGKYLPKLRKVFAHSNTDPSYINHSNKSAETLNSQNFSEINFSGSGENSFEGSGEFSQDTKDGNLIQKLLEDKSAEISTEMGGFGSIYDLSSGDGKIPDSVISTTLNTNTFGDQTFPDSMDFSSGENELNEPFPINEQEISAQFELLLPGDIFLEVAKGSGVMTNEADIK